MDWVYILPRLLMLVSSLVMCYSTFKEKHNWLYFVSVIAWIVGFILL